jgi:hypothetical protein
MRLNQTSQYLVCPRLSKLFMTLPGNTTKPRRTSFHMTKLRGKGPFNQPLSTHSMLIYPLLSLRLNLQHQIIVKAFEGKLFVAPVVLKEGDHVLESGAGTGKCFVFRRQVVTNNISIVRNMDPSTRRPSVCHCPDASYRHCISPLSHHLSHKRTILRQLYHVSA